MPNNDIKIILYAVFWKYWHNRKPKVSELPYKYQVALGKKVFEWLNYRDKYRPQWPDDLVYCSVLLDHGIERDRPDGIDIAEEMKSLMLASTFSEKEISLHKRIK